MKYNASSSLISNKKTHIINKNEYILKLKKVIIIKELYINIILKALFYITGF